MRAHSFVETLDPALARDLDLFEDWLIGASYASRTVSRRMCVMRAALRVWGTWDVRPREIAHWLDQHEGWTKTTYYSHARSAFTWALETGRVDVDPMARMKKPRTPEPAPQPLPPDILDRALATATGDLRVFLDLAYFAGLRAHEVAKIRGRDVRQDVITVAGKGGTVYRLPTHPVIWEHAQSRPRDGLWFPSPHGRLGGQPISEGTVSYRVRRHLRGLGVETGSIHRVRASYATDLLRQGTNIRVVQKLMRHRTLATTEHYLGVAEGELLDAVSRLQAPAPEAGTPSG